MVVSGALTFVVFHGLFFTITSTTSSANISLGQGLDNVILELQENIKNLNASTHRLTKENEVLKKEVAELRYLHNPCHPCVTRNSSGICDCTPVVKPLKDCLDFFQRGFKVDGVYHINGPGSSHPRVYCDQTTQGGGWTVFQRRKDGSVSFHRNWNDYKNGFGKLDDGEFWLGNEIIHELTKPSFAGTKKSALLINMRMKGKQKMEYVKYDTFEITDEKSKYVLKLDTFSGSVSDNPRLLSLHNNLKFSTYDNDNSDWGQCTTFGSPGGWWYDDCADVRLNGLYKFTKSWGEIAWDSDAKLFIQPEFVEMKVRRNV